MKATIEIPGDLFERVAAKSASEGRPVNAVAAELFQRWLDEEARADKRGAERAASETTNGPVLTRRQRAKQHPVPEWLERLRRTSEEAFRDAPAGPTAREILEQDRNRLERR